MKWDYQKKHKTINQNAPWTLISSSSKGRWQRWTKMPVIRTKKWKHYGIWQQTNNMSNYRQKWRKTAKNMRKNLKLGKRNMALKIQNRNLSARNPPRRKMKRKLKPRNPRAIKRKKRLKIHPRTRKRNDFIVSLQSSLWIYVLVGIYFYFSKSE